MRDSMFDWRTDATTAKGRQEVAQLLDALRLAPLARSLVRIIFTSIWPEAAGKPLPFVQVSVKHMEAVTQYSKGSISPQLAFLKAEGWLKTSGKGDKYQINWSKLFDVEDPPPVQPVQPVQFQNLTGPTGPVDRSNLLTTDLTGQADRSNKSTANLTGPISELDRLDRSSPGNWTGQVPEETPRDAFTPLERIANAWEESVLLQRQILERLDDLEPVIRKLDRSSDADRSNRSNSDPICMSYKNVIHDMECGELEDSEKTAAQPAPASDAKPIQEAPPMTLDAFKWPDDLYEPGKGLLPLCLEMPTGRERLYQHAVLQGGWPADAQGRLEFHATVIYCRRTSDNPGATLTTAVRGKKWGRAKWFAKQDLKDATASIGRNSPPPPEVSQQRKPHQKTPSRDWSEVDRRIDAMTDDEAFELIPETNSFLRGYFSQARAKGDARKQPTIRHALRSILDPTPKPQPVAPAPVTPGLDLAGLDLEVSRK